MSVFVSNPYSGVISLEAPFKKVLSGNKTQESTPIDVEGIEVLSRDQKISEDHLENVVQLGVRPIIKEVIESSATLAFVQSSFRQNGAITIGRFPGLLLRKDTLVFKPR